MSRHRGKRVAALAAAFGAVAVLSGCFDEPVREEFHLELGGQDQATITLETRVSNPTTEESTPELRARLDEERQRLLNGEDAWSGRFEGLEAIQDWVTFGRTAGVLTTVTRRAEIDLGRDPEALRRFFADTLIGATWRRTPEGRELFLEPLAAGRAGYRDRQRLARRLDPWSEAVSEYFAVAGDLYQYLERNPERRGPVFAVVLDDALVEADRADEEVLTAEEKPRVDRLGEAMAAVLEVLSVEPGEAYSINEISRLVYDPFPAHVTVTLPKAPTAVEGFVPGSSPRDFKVAEVSLWSALEALTTERLSPDPLALLVASETDLLGNGEPAPLVALADVAFGDLRYPLDPDATELRRELEDRLAPAPVYRLAWPATAAPASP